MLDFNREIRQTRSHPMRVRGLKHPYAGCSNCCFQSHPMRVRWLKCKLLYSVGEFVLALLSRWATKQRRMELSSIRRCCVVLAVRLERKVVAAAVAVRLCEVWHRCRRLCCRAWRGRGLSRGGIVGFFGFPASDACVPAIVVFAAFDVEA